MMSDTYYLPVDSIDLSYLDSYVKNLDNRPKLWPKNALYGESKYIQVEIIGQQDCTVAPSDTTPCHICAIDVPITHILEHNLSAKHRNFMKILKHALQRSSKQIDNQVTTNINAKLNDTYYCESCCAVINKDGRNDHELSYQHKKSKDIDAIINNFVEIFIQDNKIDNRQHNGSNISVITTNTKTNEQNNNTSDEVEKNAEQEKKVIGQQIINTPDSTQILDGIELHKKFVGDALKLCLRDMESSSSNKRPYINGDKVQIDNGKVKVVVALDNFNSFIDMEGQTYCQMCKIITSEELVHTISDNHVKNILKPMGEGFIREINNIESHCIICNEIIMTQSDHVKLNEEHKKKMRSMNVTDKQTHCKTCNVYIDTHNFKAHVESNKHKLKEKQNGTTDNIDKKKQTVNHRENQNSGTTATKTSKVDLTDIFLKKKLLTKAANAYLCNICQVILRTDFVSHVGSQQCTENCSKLLKGTKDIDICLTCSCKIPGKGTNSHLLGRTHKSNADCLRKIASNLKIEYGWIDKSSIENLVTEKAGKKEVAPVLELKSIVNPQSLPCNCGEDYVFGDLAKHIQSKKHLQYEAALLYVNKITKVGGIYACDFCNIETTIPDLHISSNTHIFNMVKKDYLNVTILKNAVYDEKDGSVDNNILNMMYSYTLKANKIREAKIGFYCDACNISLSKTDEITHMLGKSHLKVLNIVKQIK